MDIRKTCNLNYFHLAHSTTVMLLDGEGAMYQPATVFCGGSQPKALDEQLEQLRQEYNVAVANGSLVKAGRIIRRIQALEAHR